MLKGPRFANAGCRASLIVFRGREATRPPASSVRRLRLWTSAAARFGGRLVCRRRAHDSLFRSRLLSGARVRRAAGRGPARSFVGKTKTCASRTRPRGRGGKSGPFDSTCGTSGTRAPRPAALRGCPLVSVTSIRDVCVRVPLYSAVAGCPSAEAAGLLLSRC